MSRFQWLEETLRDLGKAGAARDPSEWTLRKQVMARARLLGVPFVDASSNDYLGYACGEGCGSAGSGRENWEDVGAGDSRAGVDEEAAGRFAGVSRETLRAGRLGHPSHLPGSDGASRTDECAASPGAGASRLLGGSHPAHDRLESALAGWVGHESSLLFSSGYAANVGLVSALAMKGDTVFSDSLNHASIIDGCRLSGATVVVYPHLDLSELRRLLCETPLTGRRFVVTESYFSMEGDTPDLAALRRLCDEWSACLIVDEAHALGVFGPAGSGLAAVHGILPDITVGTLGKAVGVQGAFVAGPTILRTWLWNRARSFVFSTGTSPTLATETLFHVKQVRADDRARALLATRSTALRHALGENGIVVPTQSHGPIVPVILGDNQTAIDAAAALRDRGILAYPVRPPTVPPGTARLRLTLTAAAKTAAFDYLLEVLTTTLKSQPHP